MNEFWQIITSQKAFEEMENNNNPFEQIESHSRSSYLDDFDTDEDELDYKDDDF